MSIDIAHVADELITAAPKRDSWHMHEQIHEPHGLYCPDRLLGREVRKLLYCVTPTPAVQQHFHQIGADLLVSHHPYIVDDNSIPQVILHTALDCCKGGMNDWWASVVGLDAGRRHFDRNLGWYGMIDPISFVDLRHRVEDSIGAMVEGVAYTDRWTIRSVVICSGLGGIVMEQAKRTGVDCYILGQCVADPQQSGFPAMIEIGHTLSELKPGFDWVKRVLWPLRNDIEFASTSTYMDYFCDQDGNAFGEVWDHNGGKID